MLQLNISECTVSVTNRGTSSSPAQASPGTVARPSHTAPNNADSFFLVYQLSVCILVVAPLNGSYYKYNRLVNMSTIY